MGRYSSQSLQASQSLAQLLALNSLFDAARCGDVGRALSQVIESATQVCGTADFTDPACDAILTHCYTALMDGSERPH